MTHGEALRAALLARGERRVEDGRVTKYEVWTRKWLVRRNTDGTLLPVSQGTFWFLSKRGFGIRYGVKSTESRGLRQDLREALVKEGKETKVLGSSLVD